MSVSIAQLEVPTKWDIIPIHTSDRATFKFCRRQWEWSSPARRNLIRKVKVHGVSMPLWFGTGIHYSLASYYDPALRQDPEKVFEVWFNTEWNGGIVSWNDLDYYADRDPVPVDVNVTMVDDHTGNEVPSQWYVKGLSELLPNPDVDDFMEHRALGIGMMHYYKDYAERNDNFRIIASEHLFSVPILDPDGRILVAEDNRTREGMIKEIKQVHARGRQDAIVQDLETGQYGILEHKTTARLDEDYFRHLELDPQCTTYLWAAEREAEVYDLEYKNVDFIVYNALWKKYPRKPTILGSGKPSIDRQKEMTTARLFEQTCKELGLEILLKVDPKISSYYEYLLEMGDKLFIQRGTPEMPYVTRNQAQKDNAGKALYYEAMDMLNTKSEYLYINPTKNYGCLNCIFRAPCIQKERGEDYEFTLKDAYQENYDR